MDLNDSEVMTADRNMQLCPIQDVFSPNCPQIECSIVISKSPLVYSFTYILPAFLLHLALVLLIKTLASFIGRD